VLRNGVFAAKKGSIVIMRAASGRSFGISVKAGSLFAMHSAVVSTWQTALFNALRSASPCRWPPDAHLFRGPGRLHFDEKHKILEDDEPIYAPPFGL
jgi:hypothetical protein